MIRGSFPRWIPALLLSTLFLITPVFFGRAHAAQQANPVELQKKTYEVLQAYRAARNQLIQNKSKTKSALLYKNKLKIFTGKIKYLEVEYARHSATAAAYQKKIAASKKAAPVPAKAVSTKKAVPAPKKAAAAPQASARVPVRTAPRPPMPMIPSRPVSQQFGVETIVTPQPAPKMAPPPAAVKIKKDTPAQTLKKPVVAAKKIPVVKTPVKPKGPTLEGRLSRWSKNTSEKLSRDSSQLAGIAQSQAKQFAKNTGAGIQNTAAGFQEFGRDLSAQGQYIVEIWSQRLGAFKNKLSTIQIIPQRAPSTLKPNPVPVAVQPKPEPAAPISLKPMPYASAAIAAAAQTDMPLPSFENQPIDFFAPREEAQLLPEPIQPPSHPAEAPIAAPAANEALEPEPAAAPAAKKGLLGSDWLEMDETYKTLHLLSLMGRLVNHDIIAWKSQGFYASAIDRAIANDPALANETLYHIFLDQVAQNEPETQNAIQEIRSKA